MDPNGSSLAAFSPAALRLYCKSSTLPPHAHRAKNTKKKPEANQKLSKVVLLKELYMEIERMKQDVRAAREKDGVYIPHERYALYEAETKAMKEKNEQLEIDLDVSEKVNNFHILQVIMIAGILGTLTSKKETMVSEISRNIQHSGKEESKRVHQELSYIQQISSDAKEELHKYMEKVETYFLEEAAAEARTTMESCLQDCSTTVELSKEKWENTCACINNQNKTSITEIETVVKTNICASVALHEQFNSASSSTEGELDIQVTDISEDIKESLCLDQASKKETDIMLNLCSDHLKPLRENHEDCISSIRSAADKFLGKDY